MGVSHSKIEKFLMFQEMELFISKINKFLIFPKLELFSLIFFLYFRRELSNLKKIKTHSEKISYILGMELSSPKIKYVLIFS